MNLTTILLSIIVSASIDSSAIRIGDQCRLTLEAEAAKTAAIELPAYDEWLIPGIECVKKGTVKTTERDDKRIVKQQIVLTSFADSLFAIPPQAFVIDGDTFLSGPMSLNVYQPFVLDSTIAITDIKPQMAAPEWWWETWRWVFLAIGIVLLLGIGYVVWRLVRKRHRHTRVVVVPLRPAEEVALERLDLIREHKVWKHGKEKEYHTELTDTVREYIARRFDVRSTEKTSGETLSALEPKMSEHKALYDRLQKMLQLADLVKFAKWQATPEENEQSLTTAYDFVKETTL